MISIIKQEIEMEKSLKQRLEFICEFCKTTPTFINGSIRKIDKTNLNYVEPHRIIIKNITFIVFDYSTDIYIKNLSNKIKISELENYIKSIECYFWKIVFFEISVYNISKKGEKFHGFWKLK